jgi:hypothetical protein
MMAVITLAGSLHQRGLEGTSLGSPEGLVDIVSSNKETFRADHSQSVENFIAWQDDNRTGDGPIGYYKFDWYRVSARRRRAKDITELISSR